MAQREHRIDAFAELTKYVDPRWYLKEASVNLQKGWLVMLTEHKENPTMRLIQRFSWDGRAWINDGGST